jgi:putative (di)nucleoside polyphosphate hydrolase
MREHPTYRPGVGIVLINRSGKILAARPAGATGGAWQMPEGQINRGESPRDAVFRELRAEIGSDNVAILAEGQSWRSSDVPNESIEPRSPSERLQRQRQKWFLVLYKGRDAGIKPATDNPKNEAWRWVALEELIDHAMSFGSQQYVDVLEEFSAAIRAMKPTTAPAPPGRSSGRLVSLRSVKDAHPADAEKEPVDGGPLSISDGEVNFIQGFVHDGSIGAECGLQLMGYWGYCERHAWVSFAVEMSTLRGFCSRSASLYVDILQQASTALAGNTQRAIAKQLKERGSCMICNANPKWRGLLSAAELAEAKDPARLRNFLEESAPFWRSDCCPRCITLVTGGQLCRHHMIEAINEGQSLDLRHERDYFLNMLARLENYAWSFSWGFRDIDGPEDRAAIVSAIGWCSGWSSLAKLTPLGHPSSASHVGSMR